MIHLSWFWLLILGCYVLDYNRRAARIDRFLNGREGAPVKPEKTGHSMGEIVGGVLGFAVAGVLIVATVLGLMAAMWWVLAALVNGSH